MFGGVIMLNNRTISTFNALASTWDKKHSLISGMKGTSERLLSILPRLLFPNASIADWGCGTGKVTFEALKSNLPLMIYSVDGSREMLSILKHKLSNYQFTPHQTVIPILTDLSKNITAIPDNSLDCIFMQQVLHHLGNTTTALTIAKKKLKPDGLIIELVPGENLFCDVIGKKHTPHRNDPLGRYDLNELKNFNMEVGLTPVLSFNDQWSLSFDSHKEFDLFIKDNSIVEKFENYKATNDIPREIEHPQKKTLSGNYITLITRASLHSKQYKVKSKIVV